MLSHAPFVLHPIHADGSTLPFSSDSFDVSLCITSLEFMDHPEKAIQEIHRILKPKGLLLAFFLNPQSTYVQQKLHESGSYIGTHIQQKTISSITRTITDLFDQTESWVDLFIEDDEIVPRSSNDNARLLIMKART
jgi:ubiquinone/menaquinone biosynthesis C-methylase UbiE